MSKCNNYKIKETPLKLLESYLKNRPQSTIVNNCKSIEQEINVGVPQGSSLGPLLFLIYINDLPLCTNLKVRLFADDACFSFEHHDPKYLNDIMNTELNKVNNWIKDNRLFINYSKSNFLIFNKTKKKYNFSGL